MTSIFTTIIGATTKMIAAVTILLAVVYLLFLSFVRPLQPNPDLPTFADVEKRLEAGETTDMRTFSEADRLAMEERMEEFREMQKNQQRQQSQ